MPLAHLPYRLPRRPHHQRPRRNLHIIHQHSPRRHQTILPDLNPIIHNRPIPQHRPIPHPTSVAQNLMPDSHIIPYDNIRVPMNRRIILHIRMLADGNLPHIPPHNRPRPHTRPLPNLNIPHHISELAHKRLLVYLRRNPAQTPYHCVSSLLCISYHRRRLNSAPAPFP